MHISLDCIVFFAAGEVPYNITVKALNLAGCGKEKQIYCFTKEGGNHHDVGTLTYLYQCMFVPS